MVITPSRRLQFRRQSIRQKTGQSVATPFRLLGELEPLARQLFILAFDLGIANTARKLPAFYRVGAELL